MEFIDQAIALYESPVFEWAIKGLLIYVGVLWFAMVVWVARDVINRSNNVLFQSFVILLNIALPVFGLILYMILRPSKTLIEKYYEELEYGFLAEHHSQQEEQCPRCEKALAADFLFCPSCAEQVKNSCNSCKHIYLSEYVVCPYCGRKDRTSLKSEGSKKKSVKKTKVKKANKEAKKEASADLSAPAKS